VTLEHHPGEWTHDPELGAWYFYLTPDASGPVARTIEGDDPVVHVDTDEHGRIIGIEVIVTLLPEVSGKGGADVSNLAYEVRYHRELSWWDGRYRVYVVGSSGIRLLGAAMTKRGARRIVSGVIAREKATQTSTLVETLPEQPALPKEEEE
jgi:uncharacterized protein YuzE